MKTKIFKTTFWINSRESVVMFIEASNLQEASNQATVNFNSNLNTTNVVWNQKVTEVASRKEVKDMLKRDAEFKSDSNWE